MSNVIGFLETLGSRPALSPADYANAVALLDADEAQREALLGRDAAALNDLLDGRPRMLCFVATPDEEEHETIPDDDKDDDGLPDESDPPSEK